MRPLILVVVLGGAMLWLGTGVVHADTPSVTIVPNSASQFRTITVSGAGFAPRTSLWVTFISPTGEEIAYWPVDGTATVTTDVDGWFSVSVVPALDFAGARAGRWRVSVCATDSGDCWEHTFTVRS